MHPCRSRGCKNIKGQSWRSIKNLPVQPALRASGSRLAELAIFFATSNFDLKYFCNLLTYKNVQYLIWKIWFISVWSLKPKAVVWLLTGFMLGQSTLISYHTEANGCIFFATGVDFILWSIFLLLITLFVKSHTTLVPERGWKYYILPTKVHLQDSSPGFPWICPQSSPAWLVPRARP